MNSGIQNFVYNLRTYHCHWKGLLFFRTASYSSIGRINLRNGYDIQARMIRSCSSGSITGRGVGCNSSQILVRCQILTSARCFVIRCHLLTLPDKPWQILTVWWGQTDPKERSEAQASRDTFLTIYFNSMNRSLSKPSHPSKIQFKDTMLYMVSSQSRGVRESHRCCLQCLLSVRRASTNLREVYLLYFYRNPGRYWFATVHFISTIKTNLSKVGSEATSMTSMRKPKIFCIIRHNSEATPKALGLGGRMHIFGEFEKSFTIRRETQFANVSLFGMLDLFSHPWVQNHLISMIDF